MVVMETIHLAYAYKEADVNRATRFVQEVYKNSFGTEPSPVPWYATASSESGELLGVLGLQFGKNGTLPIHKLYSIDESLLPTSYCQNKAVYYSRFAVKHKHVPALLMYMTACHSLEQGYSFGTAIFLEYLSKRLLQMGLSHVWRPVEHRALNLEHIAPKDQAYFIQPGIKCHTADLDEKRKVLQPMICKIFEQVDLTWDSELNGYMNIVRPLLSVE